MKQFKIKLIVAFCSLVFSIVLLISSFSVEEKNLYTYNIEQQANYNVYINSNEFIDREYIEEENAYISDITNYIKVDYNYSFNANDLANLNTNYDVLVTLYIDYTTTNQNLVKVEDYVIKNKYLNLENQNKININETLNIDYSKYNNEVLKFKEKYNLPVTAYLKVDFIISTNIKINDENIIQKESISEVNIELNKSVYQINKNYEGSGNFQEEEEKDIIPKLLIIIGAILYISSSIAIIIIIRKKIITTERYYEIKLNQILRKYSDIIVNIENQIDYKNKMVLEINDFEELIDVEEEIREPILHYKEADIDCFVIIDNEFVYRYNFNIDEK